MNFKKSKINKIRTFFFFTRQSWVLLAIVVTELLICVKFGWDTITKPLPRSIAIAWISFAIGLILYTIVKFVIFKPTNLAKPEEQIVHGSPVRKGAPTNDSANESKKDL